MEQLIHVVLQNVRCASDQDLQLRCEILVYFISGDYNELRESSFRMNKFVYSVKIYFLWSC